MAIAAFLPQPLLGSLAGVYVDRWSRKRTVAICNLLMMLGFLPLLLVHGSASLWIIYPVLLGESVLAQFFRAAQSALLPTLVGEDLRVSANALSGLSLHLARLAGPALGGIVVGLVGLRGVIVADAVSFGIAAQLIALIRVPMPVGAAAPAAAGALGDLDALQFGGKRRGPAQKFAHRVSCQFSLANARRAPWCSHSLTSSPKVALLTGEPVHRIADDDGHLPSAHGGAQVGQCGPFPQVAAAERLREDQRLVHWPAAFRAVGARQAASCVVSDVPSVTCPFVLTRQ
jgi:MFS family permease